MNENESENENEKGAKRTMNPESIDDLRAQLKRAEDRVASLRQETARLEKRLYRPTGVSYWIVGGFVAMALAAIPSFFVGQYSYNESVSRKNSREHALAMEAERARMAECGVSLAKTEAEIFSCQGEVSKIQPYYEPPKHPRTPTPRPCACQPGDPLCSCL